MKGWNLPILYNHLDIWHHYILSSNYLKFTLRFTYFMLTYRCFAQWNGTCVKRLYVAQCQYYIMAVCAILTVTLIICLSIGKNELTQSSWVSWLSSSYQCWNVKQLSSHVLCLTETRWSACLRTNILCWTQTFICNSLQSTCISREMCQQKVSKQSLIHGAM